MKTILVPIDFSDITLRVLDSAADMAEATGASVHLLHTVPEKINYASVGEAPFVDESVKPTDPFTDARERYPKELKQFNTLAESMRSRGVQTETTFLSGSPIDAILELIDTKPIDMVVMGSHGHGRLYELIVGSVTESILRRTNIPVLVVPSRDEVKHPRKSKWSASLAARSA